MPEIDVASNGDGASTTSTSRTPTDASGEPLPVPTTLATHTRYPRLLRSTSRSSRGSSRTSSRISSRNSSRTRRSDAVDTTSLEQASSSWGPDSWLVPEGSSGASITDVVPLSVALSEDLEGSSPTVVQPSKKRRRAYSIHDELDVEQTASTSSTSDIPLSQISHPPRNVSAKKGAKRFKARNTRILEAEARPSSSISQFDGSEVDVEIIPLPSELVKDEEDKISVYPVESSSSSANNATTSKPVPTISSEPLAEYSCPICFSPPTNATITPCGHICCGECLFTAVRSSLQRAPPAMAYREPVVARCPVCRATLEGWDGRGGGVIGLRPRTIISL